MAALIAWGLLAGIFLWLAVGGALQAARADFERNAAAAYAILHDRLRDNQAALFSFASLLSAVAPDDLEAPRILADSLMRQYPHLHHLQVARQVAAGELPAFLERARSRAANDFRLSSFASEAGSGGGPVPRREVYFPILFGYPSGSEAAAFLGRDLGTVPFLERPLLDAPGKTRQQVSPVFPAPDGDGQVVAIFRAAQRPANQAASGLLGGVLYAVLIVPVTTLEPDASVCDPSVDYLLLHLGYPETVFGDTIFHVPGAAPSALARLFLPEFSLERDFADIDEPFRFIARRQSNPQDLATVGVVGSLAFALLSLLGLSIYFRSHRRQQRRIDMQAEQIRHLAMHDQVTGLPNRRLLEDRLQRATDLARRHRERVGVLFVDIDDCRTITKRLGAERADALLRDLGNRLAACVRESDTVSRFGGDEFVLVCGGLQHASDAVAVADKVRAALSEPFVLNGESVRVTCGIGVSVYPDSSEIPATLLSQADVAMYRAKGLGRSRIQVFRAEMASALN